VLIELCEIDFVEESPLIEQHLSQLRKLAYENGYEKQLAKIEHITKVVDG
jgi:hypothetical protein